MNERLKEFMRINKLTAFEVAEKVMMSKSTVEKYVLPSNPANISQRFINAFLEAFPQVNKEWFLDGEGTMLSDDAGLTPAPLSPADLLRRNIKNKEMYERLRVFLTLHTMTAADLAKEMGISKYTLDRYLQGAMPISARFIQTFLATYPDVRRKWLVDGEGEMLKSEETANNGTAPVSNSGMSQSTLEEEYQKLMRHHEEETRALHVELDKANSIIERLTDILAKK